MRQILIVFLFISFWGMAQEDARYLDGKVPEIDGKVVFETQFDLPSTSDEELFRMLKGWAEARFSEEGNAIVFTDSVKGDLAAVGKEYIVFSSSALALDRALMSYRLVAHAANGQIILRMNGIKYDYNVSYQRDAEKYTAEEWITDKAALSKGKLNRINGKFRKGTIDYVEELFRNAQAAFSNAFVKQSVAQQPVSLIRTPVQAAAPATSAVVIPAQETPAVTAGLDGYKRISAESIPGNIIKMLSQDWMLITAGNDTEFNMMTASWGGLGYLFGKPAAFCFINPTRHTYPLMEKYEYYTLTFYTEAYRSVLQYCGSHSGRDKDKVKETGLTPLSTPSGSKAFNEAWMIVECRKLIAQPLSPESIANPEIRTEWTGKQVNTMFVGEIINVWIK